MRRARPGRAPRPSSPTRQGGGPFLALSHSVPSLNSQQYNKLMPDENGMPTLEDLDRFRRDLIGELEKTREEVRRAFQAAAEPLRTELPQMYELLKKLEERVRNLEFDRLTNKWPQPPVC
jgi:hypothetical protein